MKFIQKTWMNFIQLNLYKKKFNIIRDLYINFYFCSNYNKIKYEDKISYNFIFYMNIKIKYI